MTVTAEPLDEVRRAAGRQAWSERAADLAVMAHDASHYLLRPQAVLTPGSLPELVAALVAANDAGQGVTFRAGGTSLSGQAGGSGVLIDVRRHLDEVEVLDGGARVRCGPGAVLRRVNVTLARYGRKLGPDPASEIACTIGGVVANNSSGMTSSLTATAYRTLSSMQFVLPSGTTIDTARPDADARLRALEPDLHAGLIRLRDTVRADPRLSAIVTHQFSMKNTMGYGLNALLDHDEPADILAHLMIGSEGTLGYVASVVLDTVPVLARAATSLLVFDSIERATDALPALLGAGARAVELMDAASLRVAQTDRAAPAAIASIPVVDHTALLVEFQAPDAAALAELTGPADPVIRALDLSAPAALTQDPTERAGLWAVRKGLYAAVAGARPKGTTNLLEDVAVPAQVLTETVRGLGVLLARHGYDDAVTFGHARDANLHFMINPHLDDPRELATYEAFTEDLVDLILGANGTLKAEHGTGRIMSAYVRRQYGDELYEVMTELKRLCDPRGILNPGVLLDDDPRAHLDNLKTVTGVDPAVDSCVECGFCEPGCPSRNTTTTPRQRIILMREIAAAGPEHRAELEAAFSYDAVQTCAADSLCVTACPVKIDTGKVMKSVRAAGHGPAAQRAGAAATGAWAAATSGLRLGLTVAGAMPPALLAGATSAARTVLPHELVPQLGAGLPGAGTARSKLADLPAVGGSAARSGTRADDGGPSVPGSARVDLVFFPSCTGAMFGPEGRGEGAAAAFLTLCERAGLRAVLPDGVDGLCCGTPWESKGFVDGQAAMAARVFDGVWAATDDGKRPLVCDASSCTHGLDGLAAHLDPMRAARWDTLELLDVVSYARRELLPRIAVPAGQELASLAVHPTCSTVHLGATEDLVAVAGAVARDVRVPDDWGCCGFAGDRGLLHPELTAGATEAEAAEIKRLEASGGPFAGYASCNRTCEMGMTRATGRPYRHVLELFEEVTRPLSR
ncbi:FAD-binding and (Fe-S)-binding domain-containing protein [Occultella aeris]|uniref:D-lactate dehydrogenase (cytochrome) n=1 Tax=Occultella aeris TaxID=2761496 RepID=A0A7M4DDR9_9MICO|nr:FAD-binding and (Fe-S)-binding domain-containing protein [Occultella aeris]VZO34989.1 putative FAD-linked oxidoreductase [Occultella aeris]